MDQIGGVPAGPCRGGGEPGHLSRATGAGSVHLGPADRIGRRAGGGARHLGCIPIWKSPVRTTLAFSVVAEHPPGLRSHQVCILGSVAWLARSRVCNGIKRGGVLTVVRPEIELVVAAGDIPSKVEISLAGLDINDHISISRVKLPEDTKATIDRDFNIASISALSGLSSWRRWWWRWRGRGRKDRRGLISFSSLRRRASRTGAAFVFHGETKILRSSRPQWPL
ncbi:hypothetical protein EU800_11050 [Tropicimonas sp. IMCC6043]|nr:hypothetical protein EU800_11050 [Tropicimonas sp. IMCC6043]